MLSTTNVAISVVNSNVANDDVANNVVNKVVRDVANNVINNVVSKRRRHKSVVNNVVVNKRRRQQRRRQQQASSSTNVFGVNSAANKAIDSVVVGKRCQQERCQQLRCRQRMQRRHQTEQMKQETEQDTQNERDKPTKSTSKATAEQKEVSVRGDPTSLARTTADVTSNARCQQRPLSRLMCVRALALPYANYCFCLPPSFSPFIVGSVACRWVLASAKSRRQLADNPTVSRIRTWVVAATTRRPNH